MKSEDGRISPEKAIEILKEDGLEVTLDEAKHILEFLYQIAEIVVEQYLINSSLNSASSPIC